MDRTSPAAILRRIPFTVALLLVIVGAAILTGTHLGPIDPALRRLFGFAAIHLPAMEWYRIFTSLVLTTGGWTFYASTIMLACFVGWAEWVHGTGRTAAVFLGVHVATLLLVAFGLAFPLASAGVVRGEMLARARDVGPSAGYFGCLGLALAALRPPARRRAFGAIAIYLTARLAWSFVHVPDAGREIAADAAHFVAMPLGYVAARIRSGPRRGGSQAPSRPHDAGSCR